MAAENPVNGPGTDAIESEQSSMLSLKQYLQQKPTPINPEGTFG